MDEKAAEDFEDDIEETEPDIESKLEEMEKELQYARAEIANTRQRAIKDRSEAIRYGGSSLAKRIIPTTENLTKALSAAEQIDDNNTVSEGIKLTLEGIFSALEAEGISKIEALGQRFDPTCMEAIATIPPKEGFSSGEVCEVIENGYKMHERVLTAAKVIVTEGDA